MFFSSPRDWLLFDCFDCLVAIDTGRNRYARHLYLTTNTPHLPVAQICLLYGYKFSDLTAWKWLLSCVVALSLDFVILEPLLPLLNSFFGGDNAETVFDRFFSKGSDNILQLVGLE